MNFIFLQTHSLDPLLESNLFGLPSFPEAYRQWMSHKCVKVLQLYCQPIFFSLIWFIKLLLRLEDHLMIRTNLHASMSMLGHTMPKYELHLNNLFPDSRLSTTIIWCPPVTQLTWTLTKIWSTRSQSRILSRGRRRASLSEPSLRRGEYTMPY